MTGLADRGSESWSSANLEFTELRFYVWTGGDPGFTLTTSSGIADGATCTSLDDEDAEMRVETVTAPNVWQAGVRPGDVLETVANMRVHTMDAEAAIVLVQMSKSPSVVRFRSPTSGKRVRFDMLLGDQKLGVVFTGDGVHDIPVVSRITDRRHTGSQSADGGVSSSGMRLGDVLVAVNGMDAIAAGLDRTMRYVETCPRPLRLTFERAANEDSGDVWSGMAASTHSQVASEQSGEHRGASAIRNALPSLAASGMRARATASFRCKEFLRSLMPSASSQLQLGNGSTADSPAEGSAHAALTETSSEVLIAWHEGPLGLTLIEDDISGAPLVNRLTGKGSSSAMEHLQHGFHLYSINGVRTEGRVLKELCRDLSTLPKPVQLLFRPPRYGDASEEGEGSEHASFDSPPSSLSPNASSARKTELDADTHRELILRASVLENCYPQQLASRQVGSEYELLWTTPRLGLQLEIPDSSDTKKKTKKKSDDTLRARNRHPIIHKILRECALDLTPDTVGDLLVSVNNWRTSGMGTMELRALLQSATKPAVLRFRRCKTSPDFQAASLSSSSSASDGDGLNCSLSSISATYNILWAEGELGITFGCYEDAGRRNALVVYVKRIGPGQAKKSKLVAIGDLLRSINGQELPPKQKFKKTMRALAKTKQPVVLGFRRLLVERSPDWRAGA
ncbi:hypothetical protein BBJ28_00014893 [Nothophytophthora sp. Chile5]|nr:hypothetical protein BBJ28_00014893 [Nothophytophthora sp. Chile5]